ncbi:hypothetical protein [Aquimarina sp. Aq78]|uniref:hypothetical protein n=1 Tax=Aquimarina sp. Aq78 TaxID=1191889 RepID=UPI000D0E70EF|nr:hypothetical protein [Aquimarina sp. Aq78]
MRKSLIIIILLILNLSFGQEKADPTESLIAEFKSEMQKDNISDFFILKQIRYGTIRIIDLKDPNICNKNGHYFTMYGFWKSGNNTWIKKYDNCGGFNSIKLSESKIMDFYKSNFTKLKNQEVQEFKIKPDSIANGKTYLFYSTKSHSPLRYYWFYQGPIEFDKNFDKYNLKTKPYSKNMNHESNNNLVIVKLNVMCEEIIDNFYEKKLFNRSK